MVSETQNNGMVWLVLWKVIFDDMEFFVYVGSVHLHKSWYNNFTPQKYMVRQLAIDKFSSFPVKELSELTIYCVYLNPTIDLIPKYSFLDQNISKVCLHKNVSLHDFYTNHDT